MNKYVLSVATVATSTVMIAMANPAIAADINASVNSRIELDDAGNKDAEVFADFGIKMTRTVRADLVLNLERLYNDYVADDFNWDKFVAGATVTIDLNEKGLPVYLVVGKHHRFELKANPSKLPAGLRDSLQESGSWQQEVVGISAGIDTKYFDELQVGVFAAGEEGEFDTSTIRLTAKAQKKLNATITAAGSIVYDLNEIGENDWQASGALIFDLEKVTGIKGFSGFVEGTYYSNQPGSGVIKLDGTDYGSKTGLEFGLGYEHGKNTYSASVEKLGSEQLYRLGYSREFKGFSAGVEVSKKKKSGAKQIKALILIPFNLR